MYADPEEAGRKARTERMNPVAHLPQPAHSGHAAPAWMSGEGGSAILAGISPSEISRALGCPGLGRSCATRPTIETNDSGRGWQQQRAATAARRQPPSARPEVTTLA